MDYMESAIKIYSDVEKMCVRKSNEYRDYLHDCADNASASTLLVLAAKIDTLDMLAYSAAEKRNSYAEFRD